MTRMTIEKENLIKEMTKVAMATMTHYITDFTAYDIPTIITNESNEEYLFWFVRDTGTELQKINKEIFEIYKEYNEKYFLLDIKKGTMIEIKTFEEAEDKISTNFDFCLDK